MSFVWDKISYFFSTFYFSSEVNATGMDTQLLEKIASSLESIESSMGIGSREILLVFVAVLVSLLIFQISIRFQGWFMRRQRLKDIIDFFSSIDFRKETIEQDLRSILGLCRAVDHISLKEKSISESQSSSEFEEIHANICRSIAHKIYDIISSLRIWREEIYRLLFKSLTQQHSVEIKKIITQVDNLVVTTERFLLLLEDQGTYFKTDIESLQSYEKLLQTFEDIFSQEYFSEVYSNHYTVEEMSRSMAEWANLLMDEYLRLSQKVNDLHSQLNISLGEHNKKYKF